MSNCSECGGTGLQFVPDKRPYPLTLVGHAIERCDFCEKYTSDREAARDSDCVFTKQVDENGRGVYVILTCSRESAAYRRNQEMVGER